MTPIPLLRGTPIWDLSRVEDREAAQIRRLELCSLVHFKGAWYCAFREGAIHNNHPSGRARILRSQDGVAWESAAVLDWEGADVREPKLSVTPEGWLMVNTSLYFVSAHPRAKAPGASHYTPPEGRTLDDEEGRFYQLDWLGTVLNLPDSDAEPLVTCQSTTWLSADGTHWGSANACPTGINTWRWDVTWHGGMGYSLSQWGKDEPGGTLYRTRDGRSWRALKPNFGPGGKCNEGGLAFAADGTGLCLLRGPGRGGAVLGIGKAPYYQEWEWRELRVDYGPGLGILPAGEAFRVSLGGPQLRTLPDGRLLGAGRALGPGREEGRVTLFWVDPDQALLTVFAEADGTSYPGVAVEPDGTLALAYVGSACARGEWEIHFTRYRTT